MRAAVYRIATAGLHAGLLLLPLFCFGFAGKAVEDAAICSFLLLATAFFLAELSATAQVSRTHSLPLPERDKRAYRAALVTGLLLLAIFWTALLERAASDHGPFGWQQTLGALLMLSGICLRRAAIRTLGRFFATEITVRENQPLIRCGVYRRLRHPSETGTILIALGACLLLRSPIGLAITLVALLGVVRRRIRQEDRCLENAFAGEFRAYAGKVPALIPLALEWVIGGHRRVR